VAAKSHGFLLANESIWLVQPGLWCRGRCPQRPDAAGTARRISIAEIEGFCCLSMAFGMFCHPRDAEDSVPYRQPPLRSFMYRRENAEIPQKVNAAAVKPDKNN